MYGIDRAYDIGSLHSIGLAAVREGHSVQRFCEADVRDAQLEAAPGSPITAIINTDTIDRYQTIVDPRGGDFTAYAANPVLLWNHGLDPSIGAWPVGTVKSLTPSDRFVEAKVAFDTGGSLGAELDRLYRERILRGFSIGFIPKSYAVERIDGVDVVRYTSWELCELSAVAVPANPEALSRMFTSLRNATLRQALQPFVTRSFPLCDETWDPSEFRDASDREAADSAALVFTRGGQFEALCLHHHRDGRVNYRALIACMSRVLTQPMSCTAEQRDQLYDHLAAHYREVGVQPPEPGLMDEDRAYLLALEGRLAHIDDEGGAWIFAEPVEHEGRTLAGFASIDDERNLKLCVAPDFGPHADPTNWGTRRPARSSRVRIHA